MQMSDIQNRFDFHPAPNNEQTNEHTSVRVHCKELAFYLNEVLPEGREKSLAITHLEEVMFWSNGALARDISTMST